MKVKKREESDEVKSPEEKILSEDINIQKLIDRLDFTDENVVTEAMQQPGLFKQAIKYRIQKMRQKNKAESKLDMIRSKVYLIIKEKEGAKQTESYIKERINRNEAYRDSLKDFKRASEYEELSKKILDAYEMKMQSMRVVAQVLGAESGVQQRMEKRAQELNDVRKTLRRKYEDDNA